ncbi:MAG: hypothetical protein MK165_17770 [Pirellulaceae bacterium]|nr:hypothetical protein [Pirellulaceae bacterium]
MFEIKSIDAHAAAKQSAKLAGEKNAGEGAGPVVVSTGCFRASYWLANEIRIQPGACWDESSDQDVTVQNGPDIFNSAFRDEREMLRFIGKACSYEKDKRQDESWQHFCDLHQLLSLRWLVPDYD